MRDTMTWANKRDRGNGGVASRFHARRSRPAAPDPAMTSLFQSRHYRRGDGEPGRLGNDDHPRDYHRFL